MRALPQTFEKMTKFKDVFEKGKKYKTYTSHVIVLLDEVPPEVNEKILLGVLALKKIVGKKAVHRNTAKRRYKSALREALKTITVNPSFHIKIVALTNKNTLSCPWNDLLTDVARQIEWINREIDTKKASLHD